ncbi:MAG: NYN domain-containing protein [Pirellula sp.]
MNQALKLTMLADLSASEMRVYNALMKRKAHRAKKRDTGPPLRCLIDGYNLMFESIGAPDARLGEQSLRLARERLLAYVADRLEPADRESTWIVFDAALDIGRPAETTYRSIRLFFAKDDNSADEFLCRTIRNHSHARSLIVVSSDHQVQRVAKSCGAAAVDCEVWVSEYLPNSPLVAPATGPNANNDQSVSLPQNSLDADMDEKPNQPIDPSERDEWLQKFDLS